MTARSTSLALSALLAGLLAAPAVNALSAEAAVVKPVAVRDNYFSPRSLAISKGSSVKWTNLGSTSHIVKSNTGLFSYTLRPRGTATKTFTRAGTYEYYCPLHTGMKGTVTVR